MAKRSVCAGGLFRDGAHLPLEDLLRLLFGDLDAQIPEGLHDLLSIDATCDIQKRERGGREKERSEPQNSRYAEGASRKPTARLLTVILFVQALKDQPQFLLVVLEVVDKFFKVQLPIQILISSFYDFLQGGKKKTDKKINLWLVSSLLLFRGKEA